MMKCGSHAMKCESHVMKCGSHVMKCGSHVMFLIPRLLVTRPTRGLELFYSKVGHNY